MRFTFAKSPERTSGYDVIRTLPEAISCYCNILRILINSVKDPEGMGTFGSGATPQRLGTANVTLPRSGILEGGGLSTNLVADTEGVT